MRFIRTLQLDLSYGIFYRKWNWIVLPLFVLCGINIAQELNALGISGTFGDYLMGCFQGSLPFRSDFQQNLYFRFPSRWLLVTVGCVALSLSYPFGDFRTIGVQFLIRSKKRLNWWLSKCIWCAMQTIYYFLEGIIGLLVVCAYNGGTLNLNLTEEYLQSSFSDAPELLRLPAGYLPVVQAICMAALVMFTLCLLQMTIGLILKPVIGFLAVSSVLFISSIWFSVLAIGNFAMAIRTELFLEGGLVVLAGIGGCGLVILASVIVGCVYIRRWNVLPDRET